jgi:hypothetical protein
MEVTPIQRKELNGSISHVLWRCSKPVSYKDKDNNPQTADHVITSASTQYGVYETYVFPANSNMEILDFMELPGSEQGILDHDHVIKAFCEAHK